MRNISPKPAIITPPIKLTTALQRSEKLLNPPVFTNKWWELWLFLSWLKNKLTSNTNYYLTKANQLYYTLNQLRGDIADFIKPL